MINHKYLKLFGLTFLGPIVLGLLIVTPVSLINLRGISFTELSAWRTWQTDAYWHFLMGRIVLYSLGAWGWMSLRKRLLCTQPAFLKRLRRSEMIIALSLLMVEITRAYSRWSA